MTAAIARTAFDRVQRELGCEFMDWEGWFWPNHFGDPVAEHRAVREDVGIWDESPLRKWDFRGKDALLAADRVFTNDMLGLEVGQVRYAPFCDESGKMVGDGTVLKLADDHAWTITALDSDLEHIRQVVEGLGVAIEPMTEQLPHLQIQGPRSQKGLVETAKSPPRRMVTLAVEGEEVPEYGAAVTVDGEPAGTLAFRSPRSALANWGRCSPHSG